jgi:hypothetical protein
MAMFRVEQRGTNWYARADGTGEISQKSDIGLCSLTAGARFDFGEALTRSIRSTAEIRYQIVAEST